MRPDVIRFAAVKKWHVLPVINASVHDTMVQSTLDKQRKNKI